MNSSLTRRFVKQAKNKQLKQLRDGLIRQLYPTKIVPDDTETSVLTNLLGSFQRYAGNQQTAYDTGSVRASATSGANLLERQVERAISQVLGRTPGRGSQSFISALNEAFPVAANGQITFTSSRSMVQLYSPETDGSSTSTIGQISAKQAVLYRQASIVAGDALKVLAGLKSFVPEADIERVEALRTVISSNIKVLVDEFGRIDEPRPERVRSYFDALANHLAEFGERAYLNDPFLAATIDDEAQTSGFKLLQNYVLIIMRTAWDEYQKSEQSNSPRSYSLSERLERANVILPILAQANTDFENAMESVGFSESERRSPAARFRILAKTITLPITEEKGENKVESGQQFEQDTETAVPQMSEPELLLPNITVSDLTDWLDRFANIEGPSILSDASEYAVDFVADQGNRLFWTIVPIVAYLRTTTAPTVSRTTLGQVLSNERVSWSLDNLLGQLQVLADLAV